tara:strand:- start:118 stop:417 length:300 start_codon:yes stop_codon:yes gene_type:complete
MSKYKTCSKNPYKKVKTPKQYSLIEILNKELFEAGEVFKEVGGTEDVLILFGDGGSSDLVLCDIDDPSYVFTQEDALKPASVEFQYIKYQGKLRIKLIE